MITKIKCTVQCGCSDVRVRKPELLPEGQRPLLGPSGPKTELEWEAERAHKVLYDAWQARVCPKEETEATLILDVSLSLASMFGGAQDLDFQEVLVPASGWSVLRKTIPLCPHCAQLARDIGLTRPATKKED